MHCDNCTSQGLLQLLLHALATHHLPVVQECNEVRISLAILHVRTQPIQLDADTTAGHCHIHHCSTAQLSGTTFFPENSGHQCVGAGMMDAEVALFFNRVTRGSDDYNSDGSRAGEPIGPCESCGFDLMLRHREGQPPVIACSGVTCREKVYLPSATLSAAVSENCRQDCHHGIVHKLDLR